MKIPRPLNVGEETLARDLKAYGIPFIREYRFFPGRRWKADFFLNQHAVLVEVEGGAWTGGRHTRPKGFIGDMQKYNAAAALGFVLLRFTPEQVKKGTAIAAIRDLLTKL